MRKNSNLQFILKNFFKSNNLPVYNIVEIKDIELPVEHNCDTVCEHTFVEVKYGGDMTVTGSFNLINNL